ncbi:MAG TPA: HAD-IB family phosphatase [Acidimicrobiia bacterium]|nr:HAD-IB family phosphatase [Acidimicrobiia bacterium]
MAAVGDAVVIDLARTAVFLDFDGTISEADTGVHLMERFGGPGWREIDDAYIRGEVGSRVTLLDEWDLLPDDEALLRAAAREVPLDPGTAPLIDALRDAGAEVTIVSDGFGIRTDEVAADLGVPVLTNRVDWTTGRLEFPNEDRCCACSSCGTCKQAPIKDAHHRGLATVLVGDGTSDRKAALLADRVYAKGALAAWCAVNGVTHVRFDSLADVHRHLLGTRVR